MDFRTINYFLHLARYQHVSATADVLHISQPSLSKQIRALEKELGVKLFDRVGNRIVLNQSGEEFARHAARAMDLLAMGSTQPRAIATRPPEASILSMPHTPPFFPGAVRTTPD